jgi:hypothetical protein
LSASLLCERDLATVMCVVYEFLDDCEPPFVRSGWLDTAAFPSEFIEEHAVQPGDALNLEQLWFMPINGHAHYRFVDMSAAT